MKKYFLILLLSTVVACTSISAQFIISEEYNAYSYVHQEYNFIQYYHKEDIAPLYKAFQNANNDKVTIVHFGDSHVQAEWPSNQARQLLQAKYGDGGRGMMFCYAAAHTYSSYLYSTSYEGVWDYAKSMKIPPHLPLGVSGMTVNTKDSAASLSFNFKKEVPAGYTKLRIFCKPGKNMFSIGLYTGDTIGTAIVVPDKFEPGEPYIECDIKLTGTLIKLEMIKGVDSQNEFEFYGMSLENPENKGVIYHSAGVGAARYRAILYQPLIAEQLPPLNADLVILDYGTNDYLYDNLVKPELRSEIISVIDIIRTANPKATILLTSAQDLYRKKRNINSGEEFSNLIRSIAQEKHCLVWDWFYIAGGLQTLKKWLADGLCQKDLVHLSVSGYKLKGTLLSNALMNSLDYYEKNPSIDSLITQMDSSKFIFKNAGYVQNTVVVPDTNQHVQVITNNTTGYSYYLIKKGDTLGGIAQKYRTTVSALKKLNGMHNDNIYAGKKLKVPKK